MSQNQHVGVEHDSIPWKQMLARTFKLCSIQESGKIDLLLFKKQYS
jgi:hypothetical protein